MYVLGTLATYLHNQIKGKYKSCDEMHDAVALLFFSSSSGINEVKIKSSAAASTSSFCSERTPLKIFGNHNRTYEEKHYLIEYFLNVCIEMESRYW